MRTIKLLFVIALLSFASHNLKSQDFLPFATDNYSGISGVYLQPASIADSRLKVDITLFGVSINMNNNFLYVNKNNFFEFSSYQKNVKKNLDGTKKYIFQDAQIQSLNAMVSINPNWSIAFTARAREFVNVENFSEDMALFAYDAIVNKTYSFSSITSIGNILYQQNPRATVSTWTEFGFTSSGVVWKNSNHFVKAGITVKSLQGISATHLEASIDQIKLYTEDSIGSIGQNLYLNYGTAGDLISIQKSSNNFNIGFDLGMVYEWRPNYKNYLYDMNGEIGGERRDLNKYKIKIGFSILDIGSISYKKAPGSQNFHINNNFSLSLFNEVETLKDLNRVIDSLVSLPSNDPYYGVFTSSDHDEYFKMALPTAISFQIDYNIWENFYLNFTPYISIIQGGNTISKTRSITTFNIIPRYESKHFGISLPFQYIETKNLLVGLGLHLGPVWIGSNNLFGVLSNQEIDKLNLCLSFKVPIFYKFYNK